MGELPLVESGAGCDASPVQLAGLRAAEPHLPGSSSTVSAATVWRIAASAAVTVDRVGEPASGRIHLALPQLVDRGNLALLLEDHQVPPRRREFGRRRRGRGMLAQR